MRMNAKTDRAAEIAATDKKRGKKASTNELPMVDLDAVLTFVDKIETEGLQTLSQQEVARKLGYANQTSTPFYRRIVAAKLFGLIDTAQGLNLTRLALDYFKPIDEESRRQALVSAVKNVLAYQGMIERFTGKRLPPLDILRNSIERDFDLARETANSCADVFTRSVKTAGLVRVDGTLGAGAEQSFAQPSSERTPPAAKSAGTVNLGDPPSEESESHYLTLDTKRNRRVVVHAPPVISEAELKRIQNWLAVQLHVVESLEGIPEHPTSDGPRSSNATES
jgi:hypothetical protein